MNARKPRSCVEPNGLGLAGRLGNGDRSSDDATQQQAQQVVESSRPNSRKILLLEEVSGQTADSRVESKQIIALSATIVVNVSSTFSTSGSALGSARAHSLQYRSRCR